MKDCDLMKEYLEEMVESMDSLENNPIAEQHKVAYQRALTFLIDIIKIKG